MPSILISPVHTTPGIISRTLPRSTGYHQHHWISFASKIQASNFWKRGKNESQTFITPRSGRSNRQARTPLLHLTSLCTRTRTLLEICRIRQSMHTARSHPARLIPTTLVSNQREKTGIQHHTKPFAISTSVFLSCSHCHFPTQALDLIPAMINNHHISSHAQIFQRPPDPTSPTPLHIDLAFLPSPISLLPNFPRILPALSQAPATRRLTQSSAQSLHSHISRRSLPLRCPFLCAPSFQV